MSTMQLTDDTENIANTYIYDAFGVLIDQTGVVANNYMYTGEQYDPNAGFYYLRARYMNPELGRFVTTDPFEGMSFEPATLHKYLYANANPLFYNDPSGQWSTISEFCAAVVVRTTIFAMRHPILTATIGFAVNALIPAEVHDSMITSGMPGLSLIGRTGKAEAGFFRLLKTKKFRDIVKKNLSASGDLWNVAGHKFEEFAKKYLFKNAKDGVKFVKHIPDLILDQTTIELKTGRSLGKRELSQLAEFAKHSKDLAYVFLIKPTKETIKKIEEAGGRVLYIFDETGN